MSASRRRQRSLEAYRKKRGFKRTPGLREDKKAREVVRERPGAPVADKKKARIT